MSSPMQWTLAILSAISTAAIIGSVLIAMALFNTDIALIGLVAALLGVAYVGVREELYYRKQMKKYNDEIARLSTE